MRGDVDGEKLARSNDGRDTNRQSDQHEDDARGAQPSPTRDIGGQQVANPLSGEDGPKNGTPQDELRPTILNVVPAAAGPHKHGQHDLSKPPPIHQPNPQRGRTHRAPRTLQKRYAIPRQKDCLMKSIF